MSKKCDTCWASPEEKGKHRLLQNTHQTSQMLSSHENSLMSPKVLGRGRMIVECSVFDWTLWIPKTRSQGECRNSSLHNIILRLGTMLYVPSKIALENPFSFLLLQTVLDIMHMRPRTGGCLLCTPYHYAILYHNTTICVWMLRASCIKYYHLYKLAKIVKIL